VCNRFGNKDDVVEQFNKIVHESSVNEYVKKFEELKSIMHALNSSLLESYYIFNFVSELNKDIKPMLKILKLISLMTSFKQSKCRKNQTML
jgi:hypothetical protein